jgi:hypothetical protein
MPSTEYVDAALASMDAGAVSSAQVYATLAMVSAIRETTDGGRS